MPAYTFELIRRGETPVVANVLTLSGSLAIWRQVEALALRIEPSDGVAIRIKNPKAFAEILLFSAAIASSRLGEIDSERLSFIRT